MSRWREQYKVHPAADVFPMMSDAELDAMSKDIKANGLRDKITFQFVAGVGDVLCEGRNRVEAMERAGIKLNNSDRHILNADADVVAFIISKNMHRRHLSKEEQADATVKLAKIALEVEARGKPGQVGPVSAKGGRGKKSPVKTKAIELNAALPKDKQVSERTLKRSLAKAEGRKPKPPTIEVDYDEVMPSYRRKRRTNAEIGHDKFWNRFLAVVEGFTAIEPPTDAALDLLTAKERTDAIETLETAATVIGALLDRLRARG